MNKTRVIRIITATLLTISSLVVSAQQLLVHDAHVRATIPGTDISAVYMTLKNHNEQAVTLVGASSRVSDRVEIHEHIMADGMMKMRKRPQLTVDAHSEVELQPYGYHLMIFNLKEPLKAGQAIELTLHFADGEQQAVSIPIESIKKKKSNEHHNHH